jgi:hypothetical protein
MSEPTLAGGAAADSSGGEQIVAQEGFGPPAETQNTEESSGFNPAWKSMLDKLPPEFHKLVQPDLQAWDKNYQDTFGKLNEVQSQYEPYTELIENQIDPQQISQALQIVALIDADPQAFYNQMGDYYKWDQGQGADGEQEDFSLGGEEEQDITQNPKIQELMQNQQVIAQFLQQQIQAEETAQQEQELEQQEQALIGKHGEVLDMGMVYKLAMTNGGDLEKAADEFMQMYSNIRQTPTPGSLVPKPFAPNGAVPSNQPDPAKMDSKSTISLVKDILAAREQG